MSIHEVDVTPAHTPTPSSYTKTAGAEPIPGYRLIQPLGRGGFGEVWECEAPGGLPKAIKFVAGDRDGILEADSAAKQELQALQHCKTIRHPFALTMERVELIDSELVIVMELADRSLQDVVVELRKAGRMGIPRAELLRYLREAAEVLDFLFHEHHLQHLDIKPHNLFLVSTHIKVADFGLASSLAERRAHAAVPCGTPLYAAPEVFEGRISQHSDQYSLAITYQELLTGTLPLMGKNARQLMMQHMTAEPKLEALPPRDRPLVAKALAKDPSQRFPSCLELIHSLMHEKIILSSVTAAPAGLQDAATTPAHGFLDETLPERETAAAVGTGPVAGCDALPGYELRTCINRQLLSDLWLVRSADGSERHAQLLHAPPYRSAVVVDRLLSFAHPALPVQDILQSQSGRIYVVGDPAEPTLAERFAACRREGLPGVPRQELLDTLTQVAKALDDLQREHRFPHLTLEPKNIVLRPDRVQLAQFGMAALLWPVQVKPVAGLNPRYAAPELYEPGYSPYSDQYSLALIYAEMLMGVHARAGRVGGARGQGRLDVELLPSCDRPVLTRALDVDPARRFPSCGDFVRALMDAARPKQERGPCWPDVMPLAALSGGAVPPGSAGATVEQVAARWLLAATGATELRQQGNLRYLLYPDQAIEHRYPVRIIPGALKFKLHDLPKQWQAQVVRQEDNLVAYRISMPRTFLQRCFSGECGLETQVSVHPSDDPNPQLVDALVRIRAYGKPSNQLSQQMAELASVQLASIRTYLEEDHDRRRRERWPCSFTLRVVPVLPNETLGEPFDATARNLSHFGVGFHISQPLGTDTVYVAPRVAGFANEHALLVRISHSTPAAEGGVNVGGRFGEERTKAT